jgi:hypothetical protein
VSTVRTSSLHGSTRYQVQGPAAALAEQRAASAAARDEMASHRDQLDQHRRRAVHTVTPRGPGWCDSTRRDLYLVPPPTDETFWRTIQYRVEPADGGAVRVLQSRSTRGEMEFVVDDTRLARIVDWTKLPDLLFFNVALYFALHPEINSIWCETVDSSEYSASHADTDPTIIGTISAASSPSSDYVRADHRQRGEGTHAAPANRSVVDSDDADQSIRSMDDGPNYALVIHRWQLNAAAARDLMEHQKSFFVARNIALPPAADFVGTLHGR